MRSHKPRAAGDQDRFFLGHKRTVHHATLHLKARCISLEGALRRVGVAAEHFSSRKNVYRSRLILQAYPLSSTMSHSPFPTCRAAIRAMPAVSARAIAASHHTCDGVDVPEVVLPSAAAAVCASGSDAGGATSSTSDCSEVFCTERVRTGADFGRTAACFGGGGGTAVADIVAPGLGIRGTNGPLPLGALLREFPSPEAPHKPWYETESMMVKLVSRSAIVSPVLLKLKALSNSVPEKSGQSVLNVAGLLAMTAYEPDGSVSSPENAIILWFVPFSKSRSSVTATDEVP